ncbi:MAG: hypothetical protein H6Q64_29 [Firmicutes bacterium]|nr:hypothetical protein [Bacillota bacterium]
MIFLLLVGFGIMALIQVPALVRKRWWKELICYSLLWLTGLALSVIISMGIIIPPISAVLNKYITSALGL